MTKCALRPSLDFDPKLRFQYSWDQFRLSKRKEDFSILHFLLSLCNPSKLLWDRECNGSSNRFRKAHFMLNPCTASTNQYSPHIVSFTARASGSSEVPIYLQTFQNRQLSSYLCPKSNVILGFPAARRATAKFSQLRSSNIFDIFHRLNDYFKSHSPEAL